jgi:hypothetical protein
LDLTFVFFSHIRRDRRADEEQYQASDSSSERDAHDHLRWFARCVVGDTADGFDSSSASRQHTMDAQITPVESPLNPKPDTGASASQSRFSTAVGGLLESAKEARPVSEEPQVPEKKVPNRWAKVMGRTKVLRTFKP